MRKLLFTLFLLLVPSWALAQCNGIFPASNVCGTTSAGPNIPGPLPLSSFALTPGGTTGQGQYNNGSGGLAGEWMVVNFATIAALRANTQAIPSAYVQGYTTANDGGEGSFNYVSSDVTSADDNCTIFVDAASHRYYRTAALGYVNVKWCGAKGDGTTTDTTAINAAVKVACDGHATVANPGPFVNGLAFFPPGNYIVDGGINADNYSGGHINSGCVIQGSGQTATILQTKTGFTNNILEILGTSNITVRDLWVKASAGSTVAQVILVAASNVSGCNVIRFDNVGIQSDVNVNALFSVFSCTEGILTQVTMANYATGTHAVTALQSTNIYSASGTYATIDPSAISQAGGWNFVNTQIHDQSQVAGTSTVIPLQVQGGSAPNNFFGGIVAGSVASGTGGTITLTAGGGTLNNLGFYGTNFYADNGTQSAYTFYPNASVTGLVFDNCITFSTAAVMAAVTGVTYSDIRYTSNNNSTAVFAPPVGNNGTVTNSYISANGRSINLGGGGSFTHSFCTNPGAITAGTNTATCN